MRKPTGIRFTDDEHAAVSAYAAEHDTSFSDVVRTAVREYLDPDRGKGYLSLADVACRGGDVSTSPRPPTSSPTTTGFPFHLGAWRIATIPMSPSGHSKPRIRNSARTCKKRPRGSSAGITSSSVPTCCRGRDADSCAWRVIFNSDDA